MAYETIPNRSTGYKPPVTEWNQAIDNLADHDARLAVIEAQIETGATPAFVDMAHVVFLYKPINTDWNQMNRNADDIEDRLVALEALFPDLALTDNFVTVADRSSSYEPPVTEWNQMNDNADDHEVRLLQMEQLFDDLVYGFAADLDVTHSTVSGAELVSNWGNFGSAADVQQTTDSMKPGLETNVINGKPALLFSVPFNSNLKTAANDSALNSLPGLTIFTVFVPQTDTRPTFAHRLSKWEAGDVRRNIIIGRPGGGYTWQDVVFGVHNASSNDGDAVFSPSLANGVPHFERAVFDGSLVAAARLKYYLDGVLQSSVYYTAPGTTTYPMARPFFVGALYDYVTATYYTFKGHIAEVLIFGEALTPSRAAIIETYLAAKYGL